MSENGSMIGRHPYVLTEENRIVREILACSLEKQVVQRADGSMVELSIGQQFTLDEKRQVDDNPLAVYSITAMASSLVLAKCFSGGMEWRLGTKDGEPSVRIDKVEPDDYLTFLPGMVADYMPAEGSSES